MGTNAHKIIIERKLLPHKYLGLAGAARLELSPLAARLYVKFFFFCIFVQYPPKRVGRVLGTAVHKYSLPIVQFLV